VAFKAEELTSKIFPAVFPESDAGLWAGCPQDTLDKGGKCPDNTKKPGPPGPKGPGCGGGSAPGPRPRPKRAGELDRDALVLLQAQLRDRMAQGSAAGL
jgi:hypothetical protein